MIDRVKLRELAEKIIAAIDLPDNAEFETARWQYRAYTHPETILALLDALEAADVKNTLLSACLHKAEDERDKLRTVLDGLPQDAIDGGWTARGMIEYAKRMEARRNELLAENADLRKAAGFAGIVLSTYRAEVGDLDSAWLQEQAEAHGMIEKRQATEQCGEGCVCAEVANFPCECYFVTDSGQVAIDAARKV